VGFWIGEASEKLGYRLELWAERVIAEAVSDHNLRIVIAETDRFGKVLVLGDGEDAALQYSDRWDFYEEALAHVPLAAHPSPKRVLIIGGGDGAVLREVLKHPEVERITLVEIDAKVVELCRRHLDHGHVFDDERTELVIANGSQFISQHKAEFDVILGDYSDPYEGMPAYALLADSFYLDCREALKDGGIVALQAGSPIFQPEITRRVYRGLAGCFADVDLYFSPMPIYPGGLWVYAVASLGPDVRTPLRETTGTRFYNSRIHACLFDLFRMEFLQEPG